MNLITRAKDLGLYLAVAESLTGGLLTARLIDAPGASEVVLGGIVAYQNDLKHQLLGVNPQLLAMQSAVDPEVAAQMAEGVRSRLATKCSRSIEEVVGISTTGAAGPESVGIHAPGTVFIALSSVNGIKVFAEQFQGDRQSIRNQAVERALMVIGEEFNLFQG